MKNRSLKLLRVLGPWFAFAFLLAACDLSSLTGGATPVTILITATPAQVAANSPVPSATSTERVVVVTATPPPATATSTSTATAVPPTQTPVVIVVTATFPPQLPTQPRAASPQPVGFKYPAPTNVSPANGAGTPARCLAVTFSWSGPALAPGEWYVLEKAKADHPNDWSGMTDWTQNTSVDLGPTRTGGGCYYAFYDNYGTYIWHVLIITGNKDNHTITARISPPSQPSTVVYGP